MMTINISQISFCKMNHNYLLNKVKIFPNKENLSSKIQLFNNKNNYSAEQQSLQDSK